VLNAELLDTFQSECYTVGSNSKMPFKMYCPKRKFSKFALMGIALLSAVVLGTEVLRAEDDLDIAQSFAAHGMFLLEKGELSEAIADFSRALLFDPTNQRVEDHLLLIAQQPNINVSDRLQLLLFEDLTSINRDLHNKIKYFRQKRDDFLTALTNEGLERSFYAQELQLIEQKHSLSADELRKRRNDDYNEKDPLKILNASLSRQKQQLIQTALFLQKQFDYLREVKNEQPHVRRASVAVPQSRIVQRRRFYTENGKRIYVEPSPQSVPELRFQSSVAPIYSKKEMELFRGEIQELYARIEELRVLLVQKDDRIDEMKRELIELTLKLTENEGLITEKSDALNEDVLELEARFELGQRIIREKDEKIQSVEIELARIDRKYMVEIKDLKVAIFSKDERSRRYKQLLEEYNLKLAEATRIVEFKDAELESMNSDLGQLKAQFETIHLALKKSNQSKLNMKNANEEYKLLLRTNDKERIQLTDAVTEYKEALDAFTEELRTKDSAIEELTDELRLLRRQIQQMSSL